METVILTKKEYSELVEIKKRLEKLLEEKKKLIPRKKDNFLRAFGILKDSFKDDSSNYVSKLRKEWRE